MGIFDILRGEEPSTFEKAMFIIKGGNIGSYGEYLIEYKLKNIAKSENGKVIKNIYVPYKNRTSEIDVLFITRKGLFVIESKNYSGWIFGNEYQNQWTQCIKGGRKYRFYNPIKQNRTHVKAVQHYLKINQETIKSYIVFSEKCELKRVPNSTNEYKIIKRNELINEIKKDLKSANQTYNDKEIESIINKIYMVSNVNKEIKDNHIKQVNEIICK